MNLRRPYRPCQPAPAVSLGPDAWFLAAAAVFTVAIELLVGGWFVLAVVR
jgi:hypothetical protein